MLFTAPRFVVVDDKQEHLKAIIDVFQQLGSPCLGIHYKPEEEPDPKYFQGVRCLFLDLHLLGDQAGTDDKKHYAVIANILEQCINERSGPFILILWTEHPRHSQELKLYLEKGLDPDKPYSRPLALLNLDKQCFINIMDGTVKNLDVLRKAVVNALSSNNQLTVLLEWESDVLRAAGDTLAALLGLIPSEQRTIESLPDALDIVLSRLACEAVGQSNVKADHRSALNRALSPILIDHVINQKKDNESQKLWTKAISKHDGKLTKASAEEAGKINRMLHITLPSAETIRPTDWGAVISWPWEWSNQQFKKRTGLTISEIIEGEFKLGSHSSCTPVMVRVGAACDYAQDKKGPITYLFGIEIPNSLKPKTSLPASIWVSPVFIDNSNGNAKCLLVHFRFPIICLESNVKIRRSTPCYRLKEQLLMDLITKASNYMARPGIVQLTVK